MIDTLRTIAKITAAALPFILFCLLSRKVNLPKTDRSKQFVMPVIAVIYVIAAALLLNWFNKGLLWAIDSIPYWMRNIKRISWMPKFIVTAVMWLSNKLRQLIQSLNLRFWIFYISNVLLLLLYFVIKRFIIAIVGKAVKKDGAAHKKIAGGFYEYIEDKDQWCLKTGLTQSRSLLRVFYYTAIILSGLLFIASGVLYKHGLLKAMFYPVITVIVTGELFFYLDGVTKGEYTGTVLGENEESYKTVNYTLLRKFLRSFFSDKLLNENTSVNDTGADAVTNDEFIEQLEDDDDNYTAYVRLLNSSGADIDRNYIKSSLDMLKGKSILFNNPFYRDLIPYAFYPVNKALLNHDKVLVILGRHGIEDDIVQWLKEGVESVTGVPELWDIQKLTENTENEPDIGIITRSDVLNISVHNKNASFLSKVKFCFLLEPSKLITTAQVGLNLIVKGYLNEKKDEIVYCLCDKNCDGLVDAMSHILITEITEVAPTGRHKGTSSYMCWSPDNEDVHHRIIPNISRYLGFGTELSLAALKNQVSQTYWYGGEVFPVTDISWIADQYYYDLMKYAELPPSLEIMNDSLKYSSFMWSAPKKDNCYISVEDESNNMFEILRDFSTRAEEQGFINVISSEYMLKDYMSDNAGMFEADAKAIPYICADFVRSDRNFVLKLLLRLSTYPVREDDLKNEFSLTGIAIYNLKSQLWYEIYKCFASIDKLSEVPEDYDEAVKYCASKLITANGMSFSSELIIIKEIYNFETGEIEMAYGIENKDFIKRFVLDLRSAQYVVEDEKGDKYYLGAELTGHIYQKYLPGQFFTFSGKYYEMLYLTANGQVLVRRAADHITGRPSYRQIRKYHIEKAMTATQIGAVKNSSGLKITKEFVDFTVNTDGYYKLDSYNDLKSGKRVIFEGEKTGIPKREYRNKSVIRIDLPGSEDGTLTDSVRYTLTVMMNEVFRTIFAENASFICALTDTSFMDEKSETCSPLTYSITGEEGYYSNKSIYIVEDSGLDLGLTVAVERHFERILQIIDDYIEWHLKKLEDSLVPENDDDKLPVVIDNGEDGDGNGGENGDNGKKKKKGFFSSLFGIFKRKKPKEDKPKKKKKKKGGEEPEPGEGGEEPTGGSDNGGKEKKGFFARLFGKRKKDKKKKGKEEEDENLSDNTGIPTDGEDIPDNDGDIPEEDLIPDETDGLTDDLSDQTDEDAEPYEEDGEPYEEDGTDGDLDTEEGEADKTEAPAPEEDEEDEEDGPAADNDGEIQTEELFKRKPYHESYYFLFGDRSEPAYIDLIGTRDFLATLNLVNPLKPTRESEETVKSLEGMAALNKSDARRCDFCGREIYGVEYETLSDGRERCMNCGRTAVRSEKDFKRIFEDVKRNMEAFFGIKINAGIKVEMVNAKKLNKRKNDSIVPTKKKEERISGVAVKNRSGYSFMVENGSPRISTMLTVAHELTHIWQQINWNKNAIVKKYGKAKLGQIYEGMAEWVKVQYAYLINEPATAKQLEAAFITRSDDNGQGFVRYRMNYPFSKGTVITKDTPFKNIAVPLDPDLLGKIKITPDGVPSGKVKPTGDDDDDDGIPNAGDYDPGNGPSDRDPGAYPLFERGRLGESEQALYDRVCDAIGKFESAVAVTEGLHKDRALEIIKCVETDHPELFWYQGDCSVVYDSSSLTANRLEMKYRMSREEAERRQQKIDGALSEFLESVKPDMSDYEVTLRVYENIIDLVDYDSIGLEKQKRAPANTDEPDDLRSIYGVFVNRKAVCAGYAKATQYLLNRFGIECAYVTSETHAWNLVKLEGDYYHLDTTWGDSSNTKKDKNVSDQIGYKCFCITTEDLDKLDSHKPEPRYDLPECTAVKCNYFIRHGLYFEQSDNERLRKIIVDSLNGGRYVVAIRCKTKSIQDTIYDELVTHEKIFDFIRFANLKCKNRIELKYTVSRSDDLFTITFTFTRAK